MANYKKNITFSIAQHCSEIIKQTRRKENVRKVKLRVKFWNKFLTPSTSATYFKVHLKNNYWVKKIKWPYRKSENHLLNPITLAKCYAQGMHMYVTYLIKTIKFTLALNCLRPYFESNLLSTRRLSLSSKKDSTFRSTLSLFDLEIDQRYSVVFINRRYDTKHTHMYLDRSLTQPAERRPKQLIQKITLTNPRPMEISLPLVHYIKHW